MLNKPVPHAIPGIDPLCRAEPVRPRPCSLVGDRDPRSHEFSVQLRGFDAAKIGRQDRRGGLVDCAVQCAAEASRCAVGLVVVGEVTLGGTIEPIHNAVTLAELAVEKGAKSLLLPVSCRRQLFDLSDDGGPAGY
ncbi:hypothetical protein [Acidovorax sp.]|uniref:hypothetical protein n=1 Tax=Acidovorax sp. TaxID=1872122 RepID=UPI002ACDFF15|nr:hypothetical protein [Acidovorax sp.]MDZ7862357.1 hypothetical protein [Acidovorax sp.]